MRRRKNVSSFSSSSFDAATAATATDAAPADDVEAPAKGYFEEETVDGTAGADGLFYSLVAAADRGGGVGSSRDKAAAGTFRIGSCDQ